jgi:hypothetical protein
MKHTARALRSKLANCYATCRPEGAIVATTAAKRWEGEPVRVLDLNT